MIEDVIGDVLFGGLRLAHALAAALWVGGTLACLLTRTTTGLDQRQVWRPLRDALRAGIGVFVVSGVLITVQRLSSAALPPSYFAVLVIKVGLGILLFSLGRRVGTAPVQDGAAAWWQRSETRSVGIGAAIYGLAIALRAIYESTLRG